MSSKIEIYDRKRKKSRGRFILSYGVAFIAFIAWSILKIVGTQAETLQTSRYIFMGLAFLCLCFGIRLALTERTIRKDPLLKEAIYNELDRLNELKAWKIAFYSLTILTLIAVYLFHIMAVSLKEPIILIITYWLVGGGSFHLARYFLDR
jgi:heme/copper-type cytochrome/quinol oxidase subunit 4